MNFFSPLVSALVTFMLTYFILSHKLIDILQDVPNERSLHSKPVPRIGGVGLISGVLCGWMFMYASLVWWMVIPLLGLFVVSIFDDMHSLSVKFRLLMHVFAAAIVVVGSGLVEHQGVMVALVILFSIIWIINLYNFMDGSDGLAGGMTLFGFGIYAIASWFALNSTFMLLNFCIAASAISFLYFNIHPARILMGDAGSISMGFLAAAMGIWGWQLGVWEIWFPLLVFSPFIVDASYTLLKRILRGAKVTQAHREHYYQRLILLGWGHHKAANAGYILMVAVGISALWMRKDVFPWEIFLAWFVIYAILMILIDLRWKNFICKKND